MRTLRWMIVELSLLALLVSCTQTTSGSSHTRGEPGLPQWSHGMRIQVDWSRVDRLIEEQKYEAAATEVDEILARAQAARDEEEWTRALIKQVQLRTALHGYETAVRKLKETPWPEGLLARTVLDLFYAHGLVRYLQAYSWEIRQRERVETGAVVDLKAWTADQIWAQALAAYDKV